MLADFPPLRFDPATPRRARALQAAALAAMVLAVAALAAASLPAAGAILTAVAALAAGALSLTALRARTQPGPTLSALLGDSPHPALLASADGLILAVNRAGASLAAPGARLEDVLDPALARAGGSVYALARAAAAGGLGRGHVTLDRQDWTVQAEPVAEDRQLWRLLPVGATAAPAPLPFAAGAPDPPARDALLEELPVALVRLDAEGRIDLANAAARRLLGGEGVPGQAIDTLLEGLGKPMPVRIADTMAGRAQGRSEVARGRGGATERFLQVALTRVDDANGGHIMAVISDATELKTLEAQFVQSQKMQAVGQLAGGIAHDFNNLLTAIKGHCDLLLLRHAQGDAEHADLIQIRQNANRAASLVRQLLAFSRKQTLKPQTLHLYDTLADLANLLNRLLGEKVVLDIRNAEDIWPIRVDVRQLEQVIVNLVVNARDAMPAGGTVTLRTQKISLDQPLERDRARVPPGPYALIEVEDTGCGIPPDQIDKIFEPFFTTKRVGEGTGLGLSTAYGIIKQMDGFIFVDSTPGTGTLFQIYLPAALAEPDAPAPAPEPEAKAAFRDLTGRGVVLLVEDEAPVRSFAARALQMQGYTVLEAESGEAALEMLSDPGLKVDLFVSDVVMPGLDGPSWVREARRTRPDVSTVFVSGYAEDVFPEGKAAVPRSSFLPKPFNLTELVERVRDHMDRFGAG